MPQGCCGNNVPTYGFRIGVAFLNLGRKIAGMDPIRVEGNASNSNGQGGMMLSNDEGGGSGDQSLIRKSNSESGDIPWLEVGDAITGVTGMAGSGMKGPSGKKGKFKKGDGMTNATKKTKNTCLLYTSPSPRDKRQSRMPSSA